MRPHRQPAKRDARALVASDLRRAYRCGMAVLGVRGIVVLLGTTGLAFGGCGGGERSGAPHTGGAGSGGSAGFAGSVGAVTSGSASLAGSGGTSTVSMAGGPTGGVGGSVTPEGGNAGDAERAGAGGAGGEGGEAGTGGAATTGGAPPTTDCEPGTGFVGQLTGAGSPVPNGGIFTTNPDNVAYGDANLDGVIAAYPLGDQVHEIDVDVHEAVVTATAGAAPGPGVSTSQTDFWIADDNAVLQVTLDPELGPSCCPDFDVRAGMRISFKATEVSTFIGLGRITVASSFVEGAHDSCVLVVEPDKITDVDFYQMVRVSAILGDPLDGSGELTFWHLGLSDAVLYDFLSPNADLQKGQTVTFVGPVSPYVGYHMLVESNPDWVKVAN
jgi:hypothetical protein